MLEDQRELSVAYLFWGPGISFLFFLLQQLVAFDGTE